MKIKKREPRIVVVGSSSIDYVLKTSHHPQINESVLASQVQTFFGGKGANEAIAASRLGAKVHFVGQIGTDPRGQQILKNFIDEGVNISFISEDKKHPTGTAYVVAANGQISTVVAPAANKHLTRDKIDRAEDAIARADMVLTQLETPMKTLEYLFKKCKTLGVKIALYASPAIEITKEMEDIATFIVVKSKDLSTVFNNESRAEVLKSLPNKLFIRDDTNSTIYFDGEAMRFYRSDPDKIVSKVGMGDAFIAGLCIAYCHGNSIDECVKFGNEVSKRVAGGEGSQKSIPYLQDLI